jgi:hypothetical protein
MVSVLKRIKNPVAVVFTTAVTVLWFACHSAHGQPALGAAVQQLDRQEQCSSDVDINGACRASEYFFPEDQLTLQPEDDNEEDPMLAKMPGLDFKAYRRADISSMYREDPGVRAEKTPRFQGQAGKFVNMSPERLDLHWDNSDGPPGSFLSTTGPFESTGTGTFPDHVFYFIRPTRTDEVVCSFRVEHGRSVYYCDPFVDNDHSDPSAGVHRGPTLSKEDKLNATQQELYKKAQFNREFAPMYNNFTGGSEWLGNFPTEPPKHHMWRADYFGQEHQIQTRETHFVELPPEELLHGMNAREMRRNASDEAALMQYREPGLMNITIKAVSVAPRIFQIDGFLSDVEVDQ